MNANDIFMKSIKIHKVENAMEQSAEEAPYLGVVESAGTVDTEAFAEQMIEDGCTESKESIVRMIEGRDRAIRTCVGEQLMKVYTGDGSLVSPFIYGSFDAPDAAVGPGNAVEPQIRLGADLRDAVADIVPEEDKSVLATLNGVRIFSVMTEDVGFGYIKGKLFFTVAGTGFKPSAASAAAVSLVNKKTGVATAATVISVDSTQRIKARMSTALTAGGYRLVVTVTDGEKVRSAERAVTVLAGDTPSTAITSVKDSEGIAQAKVGMGITVEGVDLPTEDATLKVAANRLRCMNGTAEVSSVGFDTLAYDGCFVSIADNKIVLNELVWTPLTHSGATETEVVVSGATKRVPIKAS